MHEQSCWLEGHFSCIYNKACSCACGWREPGAYFCSHTMLLLSLMPTVISRGRVCKHWAKIKYVYLCQVSLLHSLGISFHFSGAICKAALLDVSKNIRVWVVMSVWQYKSQSEPFDSGSAKTDIESISLSVSAVHNNTHITSHAILLFSFTPLLVIKG